VSIRVLVVDDQAMFRAGLVAILGAQQGIEVVGEASDGRAAILQTRALTPDVVIMDVRMPHLNGIEATASILADVSLPHRPQILMLTTFDIDDYVFAALRAGASGFLLKDAAPDELATAVRTVHDGDALLSPRLTRRLVEEYASSPARPSLQQDAIAELTERETDVFGLIAAGHSNTEIAQQLFIAEQTAKTHVSRILGKLGLRDRVQAVILAYESGLLTPGRKGPDTRS
jgi:DNA-binding NarL/FixJ family response regulator